MRWQWRRGFNEFYSVVINSGSFLDPHHGQVVQRETFTKLNNSMKFQSENDILFVEDSAPDRNANTHTHSIKLNEFYCNVYVSRE